ncbi:unnamed protein product [Caenorhabditis auriculariae]|uniref:Uncharacterized protein n=1 Tax=Caenorhabditis auriculariae TaxID=2777116 RepID=A0A8S1HN25_9PELO|nr:unnamed protein product [Caenorhabditis auriculariae]
MISKERFQGAVVSKEEIKRTLKSDFGPTCLAILTSVPHIVGGSAHLLCNCHKEHRQTFLDCVIGFSSTEHRITSSPDVPSLSFRTRQSVRSHLITAYPVAH